MSFEKYFDKIYVINLKRRSDRYNYIVETLGRLNFAYTIFHATEGEELEEEFNQMYQSTPAKIGKINSTGYYGKLHTFKALLKDAIDRKLKNILILEDDIIPINDFEEHLAQVPLVNLLKNDIVYFGANQKLYTIEQLQTIKQQKFYTPSDKEETWTIGTFAIGLKSKAIHTLYKEITAIGGDTKRVDFHIFDQVRSKNLSAVTLFPNLFITDVSDSDTTITREFKDFAKNRMWDLRLYSNNKIVKSKLKGTVTNHGAKIEIIDFKNNNNDKYDVLLYAPISNSGLTTQAKQLGSFFKTLGISFRITYYVEPKINCFLNKHLVQENDIGHPRLILLLERYPKFELKGSNWEKAPKIAYINLDWLRENEVIQGKLWTDHIIFPNEHKNDMIREMFPKAKFQVLKWPSSRKINFRQRSIKDNEPINILYVGNDYDEKSRKSPFQLVDAILENKNEKLKFHLKFRKPLPEDIKQMLSDCPSSIELFEGYVSDFQMKELYEKAHINLIPNQCEGNGLSIIESIAEGVIPAALDGYPMKYNIDESFGYLIDCSEIEPKVHANQYEVSKDSILKFFNSISTKSINEKLKKLFSEQFKAADREKGFYNELKNILFDYNIISVNRLQDINRRICNLSSRKNIDVFLTTSRRPHLFQQTIKNLVKASDHYQLGEIRLTVIVDNNDKETFKILADYIEQVNIITSNDVKGLPFSFNLLLAYEKIMAERTEKFCDYICYIQDDCLINYPEVFFETMVDVRENALHEGDIGYVSAFYTPIHPGFEIREYNDYHILLSDSLDGKNIFGHRNLFHKVDRLSWYFPNGERRGNPGPVRGSHFDLWQWKESKNATSRQGLVNVIIPGLCSNISEPEKDSTWGNLSDSNEVIKLRQKTGNIYKTRRTVPILHKHHYFNPKSNKD